MKALFLFTALALAAAPGAALAASAAEAALLGKDPGTGNAYACFARHYDQAHLASHPRQNVRDMLAFVSSTYDKEEASRVNEMELGVGFRGLSRNMEVSGTCSTEVDGEKPFSCSVDCDGGHFGISTRGQSSILISIPDYVGMWDPAADDDTPGNLPKAAAFGADDKEFQLDRVDVQQCESLMTDQAKHDLLGTPLPADDAGSAQ